MKQDRKLIAYKQPYEIIDICRTHRDIDGIALTKVKLLDLVKLLPKKHSKRIVEGILAWAGYIKHPRKK